MTRKKVKLAFITNDSARKATYKKRKRGLLKKMDELTTLCDVKACAILYSPYEARPVVWPGPSGARDVISSFKRLPEMEKSKKMVSQEEFLRQRVAKAHEQLKKQQKENREKEMTHVMYQCLTGKSIQNLSLLDLSDLGWVINQHLNEINKRIDILKKDNHNPPINLNNNNANGNANNDINHNHNHSNNSNNGGGSNGNSQQQVPGQTQAMGMGPTMEGFQGQRGEQFDAMQMQMMMQPWSSFMDMMGAPSMHHDHHHSQHYHHHHHHPQIGMGMGNHDGASSSSGGGNNMNMMMMMMGGHQFGHDFHGHGHGVNPAMWPNGFFP